MFNRKQDLGVCEQDGESEIISVVKHGLLLCLANHLISQIQIPE